MGGDLAAQSEEGQGSNFIFTFKAELASGGIVPGVEDELSLAELDEPIELNLEPGEKPRILVVEDNLEMRSYIRNILTKDFNVFEASNGKEGLEILAKRKIDLITSDVMMPEMDGNDFLREVKKNQAWAKLPFIMLTALAEEDDKLAALEVGIDDYITKPFYARELLARVNNLLNNQRQRREAKPEAGTESEAITAEASLIAQIIKAIEHNVSNAGFSVKDIADEVHVSERHLQRKLKELKGISPNNFIKEIRLQHARKLFELQQHHTVLEVMHASGFKTPSHFSSLYFKRFGKLPKEYFS